MRAALLLSLVSLGCGSTIILPPASDGGATADQPTNADVPTSGDVPTTADASVPSLNGRWRLTRFEFDGDDGVRRELTDVDTQVPNASGELVAGRANGTLVVADDRLALSAGTLITGHFYTYAAGYSAGGFGVAGLLDQATGVFNPTGAAAMPVALQRNPDGTLSFSGAGFGSSRLTYARAATASVVDRISATGLAMIREVPAPPTPANLRVALFWDLVGAVPDVETNGVAVRFAGRFATYPIVLAGPPPEAVRARVGVATVALARVALYLDQDNSLSFDRLLDRPVAISPVGIAWRDGTAAVDTMNTPVRDLTPGYQYVHIHGDSSLGRPAVTPFDNTTLVAPDLPVALSMSSTPVIADVL
ncbi:MAG: hypothetical protein JWM10_1726 [Myxococcaceae bacterium]|nr:hypothetical protein [Myxococcaceae bacterium]